jgi:hypothetical protein
MTQEATDLRVLTFNQKLSVLNLNQNKVSESTSYKVELIQLLPKLLILDEHPISSRTKQTAYGEKANSETITSSGKKSDITNGRASISLLSQIPSSTPSEGDRKEEEEDVERSRIPWRNPPKVTPRYSHTLILSFHTHTMYCDCNSSSLCFISFLLFAGTASGGGRM